MKTPSFMFGLLLLVGIAVAGERTASDADDAYGYQTLRSPDDLCSSAWIDIADGTPLSLTASGTAPANDDGAAAIALPQAFEFYGHMHAGVVVSSNGYIAFADGLAEENGGHWRADCPLPAIPDNTAASFARIYALAADLERGPAGTLHWKHFTTCPRAPSFGADACTVIAWSDWRRRGLAEGDLDVQIVLYPGRREIVVQYGSLDAFAAAQTTVGIQDHGASSAALVGCGDVPAPEPASAVCFFEPRWPAGEPGTPGPGDEIFGDGFE